MLGFKICNFRKRKKHVWSKLVFGHEKVVKKNSSPSVFIDSPQQMKCTYATSKYLGAPPSPRSNDKKAKNETSNFQKTRFFFKKNRANAQKKNSKKTSLLTLIIGWGEGGQPPRYFSGHSMIQMRNNGFVAVELVNTVGKDFS